MWKKEKLLVTSNFSFSHSVFKRLVLQTCTLQGLIGKGFKPITRRQILDSSKVKKFADDNFEYDENGRTLSKRVENAVGKGAISPFPTVFSKGLFPRGVKVSLCGNGLNNSEKENF